LIVPLELNSDACGEEAARFASNRIDRAARPSRTTDGLNERRRKSKASFVS
jgi:hypothetical protein